VNFNSEIADEWARPVSRRAPLPRGRHAPRIPTAIWPAPLPTAPHTPRRPSPRAAHPPDRRLARAAVVLTARALTTAVRSCITRTMPTVAAPAVGHRRLRAGEPPYPPSPVRRRCVVAGSPSCARSHRAPRQGRTRGPRVGRADAASVGHAHCASGPSVNSAQLHPVKFY
jgi:hypothetical protein